MDILDWIPGSYVEEIVQGGENPLDMARRVNPEEIAMRAPVGVPKPLVGLHPGNSSWTARGRGGGGGRKKRNKRTEGKARWRKGQRVTRRNPKPLNGKKLCGWRRRKVSWCPSSRWTMQGTCTLGTRLPRSGEEEVKGEETLW